MNLIGMFDIAVEGVRDFAEIFANENLENRNGLR